MSALNSKIESIKPITHTDPRDIDLSELDVIEICTLNDALRHADNAMVGVINMPKCTALVIDHIDDILHITGTLRDRIAKELQGRKCSNWNERMSKVQALVARGNDDPAEELIIMAEMALLHADGTEEKGGLHV